MKKKIAFFTVGFAFNRLVRMRFYERVFPKNVEMFLFTTNKYEGDEKKHYQQRYELERTKVITLDYRPLLLPFYLRKECRKRKIERIFNLGFHTSGIFLLIATMFSEKDYVLNVLRDVFKQYRYLPFKKALEEIMILMLLFPLVHFSKKVMFTDYLNYSRAPTFFLSSKRKMKYLAAPANTNLFKIKNKIYCRKKLGLPLNKKIIIFVGRIEYEKCSDILKQLIKTNPDIHFIVIGRIVDKDFLEFVPKNIELIEKKPLEELVDYYNASDFSFCVNRGGGGIGLTSEEAMACGVPIVVSEEFKLKESEALYQTSVEFKEVQEAISKFFSLSQDEKKKLSKKARDYAEKYYSDKAWADRYIKDYLT